MQVCELQPYQIQEGARGTFILINVSSEHNWSLQRFRESQSECRDVSLVLL